MKRDADRVVSSPVLRLLCREAFTAPRSRPPTSGAGRPATVEIGTFREERYVAVSLTESRLYREHYICVGADVRGNDVTGAWWDFVTDRESQSGRHPRTDPRRMKR